jgi:hypothetical protein
MNAKEANVLNTELFNISMHKKDDFGYFFHTFVTQNLLKIVMPQFTRIRTSFGTHRNYLKDYLEPNSITLRYLDSETRYSHAFRYLNIVPFTMKYFFSDCNLLEGVLNQ